MRIVSLLPSATEILFANGAGPDVVGITATTPLMNQLRDMSVLIKDISRDILVVGGGAHPSALPEETLRETLLDLVFVAEADLSFPAICDGADPAKDRPERPPRPRRDRRRKDRRLGLHCDGDRLDQLGVFFHVLP